jgi:hypothetical protein
MFTVEIFSKPQSNHELLTDSGYTQHREDNLLTILLRNWLRCQPLLIANQMLPASWIISFSLWLSPILSSFFLRFRNKTLVVTVSYTYVA